MSDLACFIARRLCNTGHVALLPPESKRCMLRATMPPCHNAAKSPIFLCCTCFFLLHICWWRHICDTLQTHTCTSAWFKLYNKSLRQNYASAPLFVTAEMSLSTCALVQVCVCIYLRLIFALYCLCYAAAPSHRLSGLLRRQHWCYHTTLVAVAHIVIVVGHANCYCLLYQRHSSSFSSFQRYGDGVGAHSFADILVVFVFCLLFVVCLTLCPRVFSSYQFQSLICGVEKVVAWWRQCVC